MCHSKTKYLHAESSYNKMFYIHRARLVQTAAIGIVVAGFLLLVIYTPTSVIYSKYVMNNRADIMIEMESQVLPGKVFFLAC